METAQKRARRIPGPFDEVSENRMFHQYAGPSLGSALVAGLQGAAAAWTAARLSGVRGKALLKPMLAGAAAAGAIGAVDQAVYKGTVTGYGKMVKMPYREINNAADPVMLSQHKAQWDGFFDELEKIAVNIEQLRHATKSIKPIKRLVVEEWFKPTTFVRSARGRVDMGPMASRPPSKEFTRAMEAMSVKHPSAKAILAAAKKRGGKIFAADDAYRAYGGGLPPVDPAGREAFNRTALMHEKSELAGRFSEAGRFGGHRSVHPPLQDLNIAATLRGPGSSAADAIRKTRESSIDQLTQVIPGVDRLNLGHQRVSRHAMNRLQQAYERLKPVDV